MSNRLAEFPTWHMLALLMIVVWCLYSAPPQPVEMTAVEKLNAQQPRLAKMIHERRTQKF